MARKKTKTNPGLVTLIGDLKAQTRSNGAPLWRDIALRLERSRSNWAAPNLSRLSRFASEEKFILVPGKLLGSGELSSKHTVAAYSVSTSARAKIEAAGGEVVSIPDLMKKNPTGKGVFILG
ncbi:MAG: 50S ribosomal protein L18e [Candidatus Poseidoniales archaeon]|nr:50S ribosomal protein L18e [Candidatus Poseidoniales archaeon]